MLKPDISNMDLSDIARAAVPESLLSDPARFGGRPEGGCRVGTLHLRAGRVAGMTAHPDAPVCLVLPSLTEPHVHLDKCHTVERMGAVGGDLSDALAAQLRDKARWSAEDLEARMRRGLTELAQAGCGTVRTHIDWGRTADPPLAWEVACGLRAAAQALGLELEIAALTGIDQMAEPGFAHAVAKRVASDNGVLGAFLLHHPNREPGLRACFAAAEAQGLALDFHVDEGLDPALDGLDLIVKVAQQTGFEGPVLCGHACSLASRPEALPPLAEGLAECKISIAALPTTNLYLQGRVAGTPQRRGLTLVHELAKAGVNVVLGSDNVRDAFCPTGRHDPLNSLGVAVLAAHLDPPLAAHLPMVTTGARLALGLSPGHVDTAEIKDLIVVPVPDVSELLASRAVPIRATEFIQGDLANG
ncbi:MAG: amidohydrolase family protein [Pseudomonadota bacterium]